MTDNTAAPDGNSAYYYDLFMEAKAENERLCGALCDVRASITEQATDTLWMQSECPETICDFIGATLREVESENG